MLRRRFSTLTEDNWACWGKGHLTMMLGSYEPKIL